MTKVVIHNYNEVGPGVIYVREHDKIIPEVQMLCSLARDPFNPCCKQTFSTVFARPFESWQPQDCTAVLDEEIEYINGQPGREPMDPNVRNLLVSIVGGVIFEAQQQGLAMLKQNALPQYTAMPDVPNDIVALYVPCDGIYQYDETGDEDEDEAEDENMGSTTAAAHRMTLV